MVVALCAARCFDACPGRWHPAAHHPAGTPPPLLSGSPVSVR